MKKKKKELIKDLLKVVHKQQRDKELEYEVGWKAKHIIIKSKKVYNRKKRVQEDPLFHQKKYETLN